jgi:cysteine peptidase B
MGFNFILIVSFLVLGNCLVYTPRKGISKALAFVEYNEFWNKTHSTEAEKAARFRNFIENAKKIYQANRLSSFELNHAHFGFTKFSDMSPREFQIKMTGHNNIYKSKIPKLVSPKVKRIELQPAKNIDWVAKGMTTPIKNQLQCGSCWAFSATEAIESAALLAGKPTQLGSPQEIVDCDDNESGCNGGDGREAMQWVISNGGQDTESCYPYTGQDGTCAMSQCTPTNKITSVTPINADESQIYQALQQSPLAICCDASQWQNYNGGILQGSQCGDNVDHEIQLTGYNSGQGGYWVVRNSWGSSWGENGFIYLQYGTNTCDMNSEVTMANY